MTKEEMEKLEIGDIVQHVYSGTGYVIAGNYGGAAIAVKTITITNPEEWTLIRKSA